MPDIPQQAWEVDPPFPGPEGPEGPPGKGEPGPPGPEGPPGDLYLSGTVNGSGSILAGEGFSVQHTEGSGIYKIEAEPELPANAICIPNGRSVNVVATCGSNPNPSSWIVVLVSGGSEGGVETSFSFMIVKVK